MTLWGRLAPGASVTYQTGSGATGDAEASTAPLLPRNILLLREEIYDDTALNEGVRLATSSLAHGAALEVPCAARSGTLPFFRGSMPATTNAVSTVAPSRTVTAGAPSLPSAGAGSTFGPPRGSLWRLVLGMSLVTALGVGYLTHRRVRK